MVMKSNKKKKKIYEETTSELYMKGKQNIKNGVFVHIIN
jgi:outer membrane protein assembly factor BamD (BamD/ComL family)